MSFPQGLIGGSPGIITDPGNITVTSDARIRGPTPATIKQVERELNETVIEFQRNEDFDIYFDAVDCDTSDDDSVTYYDTVTYLSDLEFFVEYNFNSDMEMRLHSTITSFTTNFLKLPLEKPTLQQWQIMLQGESQPAGQWAGNRIFDRGRSLLG
jgi:hypothetical protein